MSFFGNRNKGGGNSGGGEVIISKPSSYVVSNINERNTLVGLSNGAICLVQDASSDPTVSQGFAVYQKVGESWIKISDENIINFNTNAQNTITETKTAVEEIQLLISESTFIKESPTAPTDKKSLWIEKI